MGIKITIPNTSSDTLTFGSANTTTAAQIAGIDSGSSNGQLALYTTASGTSTEKVRVDSSGNVGIGTSSPSTPLGSAKGLVIGGGANDAQFRLQNNVTGSTSSDGAVLSMATDSNFYLFNYEAGATIFGTNNTERARIDSSGRVLVNRTSAFSDGNIGNPLFQASNIVANSAAAAFITTTTSTQGLVGFVNGNGTVGVINTSGSSTSYVTSSDYRLKENIAPMNGALVKVAALKPVTYQWKVDGSDGQGFIAHELQEVCPDAVTGKKDAVDADGNPVYQGIDTSFLVATLTAAIQEQQAIIQTLTDRITALENK